MSLLIIIINYYIAKNLLRAVKRSVMRRIVLPIVRCRFLEENESGLRFRWNKIWRFTESGTTLYEACGSSSMSTAFSFRTLRIILRAVLSLTLCCRPPCPNSLANSLSSVRKSNRRPRTDSQCGFCGCVALSKPLNCSFTFTSISIS